MIEKSNKRVGEPEDLVGVIARDKAAIGVFLCIEPPTKPMHKEAADAGFYTSPQNTKHPRLQILTIEELLAGKKIDMPAWSERQTFKKAPKAKGSATAEPKLF